MIDVTRPFLSVKGLVSQTKMYYISEDVKMEKQFSMDDPHGVGITVGYSGGSRISERGVLK